MFQIMLAVDQLVNALFGGYADETLSSRAYRAEQNGRVAGKLFRPLIDTLFFWQKEHCKNAYLSEVNKLQQPEQVREDSVRKS